MPIQSQVLQYYSSLSTLPSKTVAELLSYRLTSEIPVILDRLAEACQKHQSQSPSTQLKLTWLIQPSNPPAIEPDVHHSVCTRLRNFSNILDKELRVQDDTTLSYLLYHDFPALLREIKQISHNFNPVQTHVSASTNYLQPHTKDINYLADWVESFLPTRELVPYDLNALLLRIWRYSQNPRLHPHFNPESPLICIRPSDAHLITTKIREEFLATVSKIQTTLIEVLVEEQPYLPLADESLLCGTMAEVNNVFVSDWGVQVRSDLRPCLIFELPTPSIIRRTSQPTLSALVANLNLLQETIATAGMNLEVVWSKPSIRAEIYFNPSKLNPLGSYRTCSAEYQQVTQSNYQKESLRFTYQHQLPPPNDHTYNICITYNSGRLDAKALQSLPNILIRTNELCRALPFVTQINISISNETTRLLDQTILMGDYSSAALSNLALTSPSDAPDQSELGLEQHLAAGSRIIFDGLTYFDQAFEAPLQELTSLALPISVPVEWISATEQLVSPIYSKAVELLNFLHQKDPAPKLPLGIRLEQTTNDTEKNRPNFPRHLSVFDGAGFLLCEANYHHESSLLTFEYYNQPIIAGIIPALYRAIEAIRAHHQTLTTPRIVAALSKELGELKDPLLTAIESLVTALQDTKESGDLPLLAHLCLEQVFVERGTL